MVQDDLFSNLYTWVIFLLKYSLYLFILCQNFLISTEFHDDL